MRYNHSLILLIILVASSISLTVVADSELKSVNYVIVYDEGHSQFFTHELMSTALASLNNSFDTSDLNINIELVINKGNLNETNLQGADLLIIANPGQNASVDCNGDESECASTSTFRTNDGSILYLANPISHNRNVSINAEGLDAFLGEVLEANLKKPDGGDIQNSTVLLDNFNNDGNRSHVYFSANNIRPEVLTTEINDLSNSNILYYGASLTTERPKSLLDVAGNGSLSSFTVDKNHEIVLDEISTGSNHPPLWMAGDTYNDEGGRTLLIGSTIMFSDYPYDNTSSWIDQASNLEFFQNIIAWLLKITPREEVILIATENFPYFIRINLIAGFILGSSLFLIIFGSLVYKGNLSLTNIFSVRMKRPKKVAREKTSDKSEEDKIKSKKKKARQRRKRT